METDIYRAPEAELQTATEMTKQEFYVVSKTKFVVLFFVTVGIYSIYWFYCHWKQHKRASGESMLPVMRAIFSIFFTHSLFYTIQSRIEESGEDHKWHPSILATIYVLVSVVGGTCDVVSGAFPELPILGLVNFSTLPLVGWVLYEAQKAANIACGDAEAKSNAEFTLANYIWILLGVFVWALTLLGIYEIIFGLPY